MSDRWSKCYTCRATTWPWYGRWCINSVRSRSRSAMPVWVRCRQAKRKKSRTARFEPATVAPVASQNESHGWYNLSQVNQLKKMCVRGKFCGISHLTFRKGNPWDGTPATGIVCRGAVLAPPTGPGITSECNVVQLATKTPFEVADLTVILMLPMVMFLLAWPNCRSFKSCVPYVYLSFKIMIQKKWFTNLEGMVSLWVPCPCFLFCVWQRSRTARFCGYAEGETTGVQEVAHLAIANRNRPRAVPHGLHSHCV